MPAEVKIQRVGHRINYEIVGELVDVRLACENIEKFFHPAGYGTHFDQPTEIEPDGWRVTGYRWDSCD